MTDLSCNVPLDTASLDESSNRQSVDSFIEIISKTPEAQAFLVSYLKLHVDKRTSFMNDAVLRGGMHAMSQIDDAVCLMAKLTILLEATPAQHMYDVDAIKDAMLLVKHAVTKFVSCIKKA
ncbi:MAG: hypothetical protein M0R68_15325 [Bacteroidetes bacterium]|nr:hypothetical protein [Bacteroidota bacterium]